MSKISIQPTNCLNLQISTAHIRTDASLSQLLNEMDVYQEAPFGLTLDELKALDQVRLRLSQLTFSLSSLWQTVYTSNPLPDP